MHIGDTHAVRVIQNPVRMYEVGQKLNNCLASLWASFALSARTKKTAYLEIHKLTRKKSKQGVVSLTLGENSLLSVAEIQLDKKGKILCVIQHRCSFNQKPPQREADVLSAYLQKTGASK